ncbi:MAG: type II secretion system protein [Candidatus Omnitrophica bacterium]|nr:type II secretion system protein [Candidatus Omnitrophota bacterium]
MCGTKTIKKTKEGFTVIELLVAASIMGVVGLAVLSTFGAGLRAFDRVQAFGGPQADVLIFLDQFEHDLRNTLKTSGIKFTGTAQKVSFAVLGSKLDEDDNELAYLGEKSYYFDSAQGAVVSEQRDYAQAVSPSESRDVATARVAQVTGLKFKYYFYKERIENEQKKYEYGWKDTWYDEKNPPKGVSVELTFRNGEQETSWRRTVFIPAGGDIPSDDGAQAEGQGGGEV